MNHTKNDMVTFSLFEKFYQKLERQDFVQDRTGVKLVEEISPVLHLNPMQPIIDLGVRKTSEEYVVKELAWYDSQSLDVEEIAPHAKMWQEVSSNDNKINSNYGWMIYSAANGNQYINCLAELKSNPASRRAVMIYQRPSMWKDWNHNGMNDFVCTDGVQVMIRDNKLIYIIKQRSCDAIYGYFNDFAWHSVVYQRLYNDLLNFDGYLQVGEILYVPFSIHVYEKHFDLLRKIHEYYEELKDSERMKEIESYYMSELERGNAILLDKNKEV